MSDDTQETRGRKRTLTAAQAAELKRRYRMWRDNAPKRLCAEYDISRGSLVRYINNRHRSS